MKIENFNIKKEKKIILKRKKIILKKKNSKNKNLKSYMTY